ncbi:(-)-alpha-pinene synthase-like [Syzygium oleosum]|uniref:(-)-alpha-pinene synthase-like n=1 Tax=Syzygium oleosum TaxID=219896 RepID=UPI0024B9674C|nr:(-)-alpha-pinene synthase-like [Syzygium oleosum]
MSVQVSAIPSSSPSKGRSGGVERRSTEYHESVWGDYFLKYASPSNSTKLKFLGRVEEQVEELKGVVRKILTDDVADKPSQMLHLIDQIQLLGIDYHFERKIDEQLEHIHKSYSQLDHGGFMGDDLHMVDYYVSIAVTTRFQYHIGGL